jgi:hypothetical protein
VNEENVHLLANSYNILKVRKNYFPQLLNLRCVSNIRQVKIHTSEQLAPNLSPLEVNIAIAKLKNTDRKVMIKFHQNGFKLEVNHNCL